MINRKIPIYKLFLRFENAKYSSLETRRLFIPFFLLGILEQLVINIIASRNSKIPMFSAVEEDSTENISFGSHDKYDNTEVLKMVKETNYKTTGFIEHILINEVNPSEDFCKECEIFFIKQFKDICSLFQSPTLPFNIWDIIMKSQNRNINELPSQFKKSLKYGLLVSFNIEACQLDCFKRSSEVIENFQIKLEEYYVY